MNCFSCTPDADRVTKIDYASGTGGTFKCGDIKKFVLKVSNKYHQAHSLGTACSTEFTYTALQSIQTKVFNQVMVRSADFGQGVYNTGNVPHQNRLDFFVTFFIKKKSKYDLPFKRSVLNRVHLHRLAECPNESVQPSHGTKCRFWLRTVQHRKCSASKSAWFFCYFFYQEKK